MRHWILLTKEHSEAVWVVPEGDHQTYEIAPEDDLKRGDEVYLWSNPHSSIFSWGIVAETPHTYKVEVPRRVGDVEATKRMSVLVNRLKEFRPPISDEMMARDRNLRKLIPTGYDDLYALELRPVQAGYINDFIRERRLDAPPASATVSWSPLDNVSDITVQALLTFGDKTNEGRLVEGVRIAWDEIIRLIGHNPEEIYNIDPQKFEELIAGAYERTGLYDEVILTPRSGDGGRDVIAVKHGIGSLRIFDQVKRYRISRPVTAEEVRSLAGVISMAPNVSKGVITTTSTFAPTLLDDPDIARWVPHRLELRPRDVLLPWLQSLRRR
jgi:restriction system protein